MHGVFVICRTWYNTAVVLFSAALAGWCGFALLDPPRVHSLVVMQCSEKAVDKPYLWCFRGECIHTVRIIRKVTPVGRISKLILRTLEKVGASAERCARRDLSNVRILVVCAPLALEKLGSESRARVCVVY